MVPKLARGHFIMTGRFWLTPSRLLKARIRGCDGVVYRSFQKGSPRIDAVIVGNDPDADTLYYAKRRGVVVVDEAALNAHYHLLDGTNPRLATLRTLVHGAPSREAWDAICTELELWPVGSALDPALDYVAAHTQTWPAHECVGFNQWSKRALSGSKTPLKVVRTVPVGATRMTPKMAAMLMEQLSVNTTRLLFVAPFFSGTEAVLYHPKAEQLRGIELKAGIDHAIGPLTEALLASKHVFNVEEVALNHPHAHRFRERLMGAKGLPALRHVHR